MKLSPTFIFLIPQEDCRRKKYTQKNADTLGSMEQGNLKGRQQGIQLSVSASVQGAGRQQGAPANDTALWPSLSFFPETPSHLPRDKMATQHLKPFLSHSGIREVQQPLGYRLLCSKNCRLLWVFFFSLSPSSFSLSFKAKETAQRSLTHVIWKYCDNQEIGLVSRETTVAASFLLFFKSNFDSSSPVRKKFTKYTSEGVCVDSRVIFSLMPGTSSLLPALCPHASRVLLCTFEPVGKGFEKKVSQSHSSSHFDSLVREDRNLSEAKQANLWLM